MLVTQIMDYYSMTCNKGIPYPQVMLLYLSRQTKDLCFLGSINIIQDCNKSLIAMNNVTNKYVSIHLVDFVN